MGKPMSLRLDWEIESEQQPVRQSSGEDPESRRQRRRRRLMILLLPLVLALLVAAVAAFVVFRLRQVDAEVEQVLRDTVDAEIATLRIGDEQAFLNFQRSATGEWQITQQEVFSSYQAQKIGGDLQLTGQVVAVEIDGNRARAQVQEIVDDAPFVRTWFYWRYEDGWRHVPPDYTFWGEVDTLEANNLTIRYGEVDAALATAMQTTLSGWMQTACASLGCGEIPALQIEILPDPGLKTDWAGDWTLRVRSPYTALARMDAPFDFSMQFEVANLLAERLVSTVSGGMEPAYPTDAFYLRSSIVSWLVGRLISINTNTFLLDSLARNYGDAAVGSLLKAMPPNSSVSLFNNVTGTTTLAQANLDWRDFLTWRLALEDELIRRGDEGNYLALYDTRDETARNLAYQRYNAGSTGESLVVVSVTPETASDGTVQLRALAEVGSPATRQEEVLFRLVNEGWLRAN
jgi:hypothetical protein